MRVSKVVLASAAASMVAMPVAASAAAKANPAAKLSLGNTAPAQSVRASSKRGKSKQEGSGTGLIVAGLAVGAVVLGTLAATSGDSDSDSN